MNIPMMTLEEALDDACDFAAKIFAEFGAVDSMWIAYMPDGRRVPIPIPFTGPESKDHITSLLCAAFKKFGVIQYAMMTEAWMREYRSEEEVPQWIRDGGSLADDPKRIEILSIVAEDKIDIVHRTYEIVRPVGSKPVLKEMLLPETLHTAGRMIGLLRD